MGGYYIILVKVLVFNILYFMHLHFIKCALRGNLHCWLKSNPFLLHSDFYARTQNISFFERANNWLQNSITMRIFTIGILILLLLIPVSMVESLIREREYRLESAINEVSAKWGDPQTITGLIVTLPYYTYSKAN